MNYTLFKNVSVEPHWLATGGASWYVTIMCEVIIFQLNCDLRIQNNRFFL